jgi:hypothetical protein
MRMESNIAARLILLAAIAAIILGMFVTGWADDKAPPGSGGRGGPVSVTATNGTR